jgi:hypothetical protein
MEFAGGTLAKMAARNYATGVVDMTRGELGTAKAGFARTERIKRRMLKKIAKTWALPTQVAVVERAPESNSHGAVLPRIA